jgi:hypothetical protein
MREISPSEIQYFRNSGNGLDKRFVNINERQILYFLK